MNTEGIEFNAPSESSPQFMSEKPKLEETSKHSPTVDDGPTQSAIYLQTDITPHSLPVNFEVQFDFGARAFDAIQKPAQSENGLLFTMGHRATIRALLMDQALGSGY